jgi:hypothetical protein
MSIRLLVVAATAGLALVPAALGSQPRTTAPPPVVDVRVTITDSAISMSPRSAVRGAFARFILINLGTKPHALTLGTAKRGTGKQTGFSSSLRPKQQKVLLLFLDYRGRLPYFGSLPADRTKSGMKGVFTIT